MEKVSRRLTAEEIEREVIRIIAGKVDMEPAQVTRDRAFMNDLPMDSLDRIEIIMDLEERFDLNIEEEEADRIKTVGEAIDHIVAKTAQEP